MKRFYGKQKVFKITDHYPILDEEGEEVYYIDQDFRLVGNTVHVSDRNQKPLFTIDKVIFTFLPKFQIAFVDGREAWIEQNFSFFKKNISVYLPNREISVRGDILDKDFAIYEGETLLGQVNRKLFAIGDTFEMLVYKDEDQDMIIALMIAIDYIVDLSQNRG